MHATHAYVFKYLRNVGTYLENPENVGCYYGRKFLAESQEMKSRRKSARNSKRINSLLAAPLKNSLFQAFRVTKISGAKWANGAVVTEEWKKGSKCWVESRGSTQASFGFFFTLHFTEWTSETHYLEKVKSVTTWNPSTNLNFIGLLGSHFIYNSSFSFFFP